MQDKTVNLNLDQAAPPAIIRVTQGDTAWRWHFPVWLDGTRWTIPSGARAILKGTKPDGHVFAYSGSISSNEVVVDCRLQMTICAGPVGCTLIILDGDNKRLHVARIALLVAADPEGSFDVASDSALPAYAEVLDGIGDLLELAATIPDDLPGYITNWLDNNIDPATGYVLDNTLTLSNAAAPADKVGELKNAINDSADTSPFCFWVKGLVMDSTGALTRSNRSALSNFVDAVTLRNATPQNDTDGKPVSVFVYEYDESLTYIQRIPLSGVSNYYPSQNCAFIRVQVSYASSVGKTISDATLDLVNIKSIRKICCLADDSNEIDLNKVTASTIGGVTANGAANFSDANTLSRCKAICLNCINSSFGRKLRIYANAVKNTTIYLYNYMYWENLAYVSGEPVVISAGEYLDVDISQYNYLYYSARNSSGVSTEPSKIEILPDVTAHQMQEVYAAGLAFANDYGSLSDYDSTKITSAGYHPAEGFENKVTIDKYMVCDNVQYKTLVSFTDQSLGCVVLGTKSASYTSSVHATVVKFDFENGIVQFLTGAAGEGANVSGDTLPEYVYDSFPLQNLSGFMYTLEIGRIERCIYARVYNRKTGKLCGEKILTEYLTESSYGKKAGACYDFPTFAALTDNVVFERVSLSFPSGVFAAFVGDSITEGSQTPVANSWANLAGNYIGNCINCGRGGGSILHAQRCVDDILAIIKPKYVIVTIGTNGGNTSARLDTLISSIKAIGAIPIVNCIARNSSSVAAINNLILSKNTEHCRFDIATSIDNDLDKGQDESLFNEDLVHPNVAGHLAMFNEFMSNFSGIVLSRYSI